MSATKARFNIVDFINPSGSTVYRVTGRRVDGKQVRANYKTFEEAITRKQELEIAAHNGTGAFTVKRTRLTEQELKDAETAIGLLKVPLLR